MNKGKELRRWIILPVDITSAKQIVRIDSKLPSQMRICKGILVSVCSYLDVPANIEQLGEISLLFNTGGSHPFHSMVAYNKEPVNNYNKNIIIKEYLLSNQTITGFYKDNNTSRNNAGEFLPYSLNIYLDCRYKG